MSVFRSIIALAVAMVSPALATIQYNSNNSTTGFDATATGSLPAGWTSISGTWATRTDAPLVGAHVKSFGDTTNTNGDVAVYTGFSTADQEVDASQTLLLNGASVGVGVRSNATGTQGYLCNFVASSGGAVAVYLFKKTSATAYTLLKSTISAYTITGTSDVVNARMVVYGTTISCKVWSAKNQEPYGPTLSTSDTTYTTGSPFLYMGEGSTTAAAGISDISVNDTPYGITTSITGLLPSPVASNVGISFQMYYLGTIPTGINYAIDGSTTYSAATLSGSASPLAVTIPKQAIGYHQFVFQAANATTETAAAPVFNVLNTILTPVSVSNAVLSPGNWDLSSTTGEAITNNAGAYFRQLFTGSTATLNFDLAYMPASASQIYYRVDGGAWVLASLSAVSITVAIPANDVLTQHLLEMRVKSTGEGVVPAATLYRWSVNTANSPAVRFTGVALPTGQSVSKPYQYPNTILVDGDSITEGYETLCLSTTASGLNDVDCSDSTVGYAFNLGQVLNAEVGVIGFGGQGFTKTGVGNVPVVGTTIGLLNSLGTVRSFSGVTALIINQGTNDGTADIVTAATSVFNQITAANPTIPVFVLRPFNGAEAVNLQTAIGAAGVPSQFHYIDTTSLGGLTTGVNSYDGLHPNAGQNLGVYAPGLGAIIAPYLKGVGSVQCNGARSCAIVAGSNLAGG